MLPRAVPHNIFKFKVKEEIRSPLKDIDVTDGS